MSGYQWLVLILCFLVVAADGMDVAIMGFVAPSIIQDWHISKAAFGVVISSAPLGLVFGALFAGPSSDKFGRKIVLIFSVLFFGIFTLAASFAADTTHLALLRFISGIGLGAAMPNTTTLLSEYVPDARRSLMVTLMFTGFNLGSALVGFVAAALLPSHGWRTVLSVGGILPLLLVPALWWLLPESSRFLAVKKAPAERIAALMSKVCGTHFPAGTTFSSPEPTIAAKTPVRLLFSPEFRKTTLSLWGTYFMGLLVIYLLTGWLPTLFKEAGLPIEKAAGFTAMFQIGGTIGGIFVGWLMDRTKPTKIISFAYAGGAAAVLLLANTTGVSFALALLVALVGFCMSGAQTGLNAYAPTCYPTFGRATGVSWMLGIGRFGSIVGSLIGGVLLGMGWGFSTILSLLAIPAAIAAISLLIAQRR